MGSKRPIKGNSGKAARKNLVRRVLSVLGLFAGVLLVSELAGFGAKRRRAQRAAAVGLGRQSRRVAKILHRRAEHAVSANGDNSHLDEKETENLELVLSASVHLVDVKVPHGSSIEDPENPSSYNDGVMGEFCALDWSKHKANPSSVPMFRDLVGLSSDCESNRFQLGIKHVANLARERDREAKKDSGGTAVPRSMVPTGVVFHESRCGSTLVANSLAAMDPARNRVYSESAPPLVALRHCGEHESRCSNDVAAALLRDVVYLMGRTRDAKEENLFFKIQSLGTRYIDLFRAAFPDTPFLFVYRDPVQVMMSHLDHQNVEHANCVRPRANPPRSVLKLVSDHGMKVKGLSNEEYCAAHLASICEAALAEMQVSEKGRALNYKDLPGELFNIIPNHFKVSIGEAERTRITDVSTKYSKARNTGKEWKDDSERKERRASEAIKAASGLFLESSFEVLEQLAASPFEDEI